MERERERYVLQLNRNRRNICTVENFDDDNADNVVLSGFRVLGRRVEERLNSAKFFAQIFFTVVTCLPHHACMRNKSYITLYIVHAKE